MQNQDEKVPPLLYLAGGKEEELAANCLDISCVLGLLITLPNPFSSLKHPQGSAALHAEPCKAKNSEGHSLQPPPHPGQVPSVP